MRLLHPSCENFLLEVVALSLSLGINDVDMVLKIYLLCVQVRIYAVGERKATLEKIGARIDPSDGFQRDTWVLHEHVSLCTL